MMLLPYLEYTYILCSCVQKLVQSRAFTAAEDHDCNTPLHIACQKGHLKIVKFLMEHTRVDWEAKSVISCFTSDMYLNPLFLHSNKVLGTPLSCAAAYGHSDVVKYLLSKDISIDGGYEHCILQVYMCL